MRGREKNLILANLMLTSSSHSPNRVLTKERDPNTL
jgi:hypothetical protein